jgi:hypothetical protein
MYLTRQQREAVLRLYRRTEQEHHLRGYRKFRRNVTPTFACDGAVCVPFAGMFVCVERDGYSHT